MSKVDYVAINRVYWDTYAHEWRAGGERLWAGEPVWGIWERPEYELRLLPKDMRGMDAIELGCGTAFVSGWMARRGARVVGIDNSERQLDTARDLAARHDTPLTLIHGNAEAVPYPDASFDFAISEYGAAIWTDPYLWIAEAWRLLRPGGRLVFLGHHPLAIAAQDINSDDGVTRTLKTPYFGMHRFDWADDSDATTEFNLPISEWIRLFTDTGFDVIGFEEVRAQPERTDVKFEVPAAWARDYPTEQVWKLQKRKHGAHDLRTVPFSPALARPVVEMWRRSFEQGVGIEPIRPFDSHVDFLIQDVASSHLVRVILAGETVVACIAATREMIGHLYVDPEFQRRGIGTSLLNWAKLRSNDHLWLRSFDRNTAARAFFEAHGFEPVIHGFDARWQLSDARYEWTARSPAVVEP